MVEVSEELIKKISEEHKIPIETVRRAVKTIPKEIVEAKGIVRDILRTFNCFRCRTILISGFRKAYRCSVCELLSA